MPPVSTSLIQPNSFQHFLRLLVSTSEHLLSKIIIYLRRNPFFFTLNFFFIFIHIHQMFSNLVTPFHLSFFITSISYNSPSHISSFCLLDFISLWSIFYFLSNLFSFFFLLISAQLSWKSVHGFAFLENHPTLCFIVNSC